jgi:hypothetical protein
MTIHYTELDCYADVVEGYVHLTDFQVDFTALFRDCFAEQIEITPVRVDNETGVELPGDITQAERNQIIEMVEMISEDYFHGEV